MIKNVTRGSVLCRKVERADTPASRAKGLMFRDRLDGGMLMVFERPQRVGIWMLGMRISIDIIWIDAQGKIVKIKHNARPWLYMGYPLKKASMVLEVQAGVCKKTGTVVGDRLEGL